MVTERTNKPLRCAGLDTTTGHGVDSLFDASLTQDPWAKRCLANLVDTVINHENTVFPSPSAALIQYPEDEYLPKSFVELRERHLIRLKTDKAADGLTLTSRLLRTEYQNFAEMAKTHARELVGWAEFHKTSPRITASHDIVVPRRVADEFWQSRKDKRLSEKLGIPDDYLAYAFDAFMRGIQYQRILGPEVPYFAHPLRSRVLGNLPKVLALPDRWSWGRYFLELVERDATLDMNRVLDYVVSVKEATIEVRATWYDIEAHRDVDAIDLISTVAAEANLPAKVKERTLVRIKTALQVGAIVVLWAPIVSAVIGLGAIGLENWRGVVPGKVGRIRCLRGHLEWPGLVK